MAGLPATDFDVRLGERLRVARIRADVTQRQLGAAMGVSAAQLQKYEKGINCISASGLQRAAQRLGLTPSHFYDADPTSGPMPDLGQALARTRDVLQRVVDELAGVPA